MTNNRSVTIEYGGTLAHYGVPNQKHGDRKYQYLDGSYTPLGKIHYAKMRAEHRKADRERAKKEREKTERREDVQSGNLTKILKHPEKYSKKELEAARERAKAITELKKINADQVPYDEASKSATMSAISKLGKNAQTVSTMFTNSKQLIDNGVTMWNNMAALSNALGGPKLKPINLSPKTDGEKKGGLSDEQIRKTLTAITSNAEVTDDVKKAITKAVGAADINAIVKQLKTNATISVATDTELRRLILAAGLNIS